MSKIIFNAHFRNTRTRIQSISGRMGDFIFRTSHDGQISAFYKPRSATFIDSSPTHSRTIIESLSNQLREIVGYLGLEITSINFKIK